MIKNLVKRIKQMNSQRSNFGDSLPVIDSFEAQKSVFLRGMSKHALGLYEKQNDIKRFTKLALSNPEDTSHNSIINNLLSQNKISDYLSDEKLFDLSENDKLLKDLNL